MKRRRAPAVRTDTVTHTHLEDANEVLLVDAEKMAVVFSQDDGGGSGGVVQQSQLAKVFTLM